MGEKSDTPSSTIDVASQQPKRKRRKTMDDSEAKGMPSHMMELDLSPRKGELVFLKTKAEVEAGNATVDGYTVEIPTKSASVVLGLIKKKIPGESSMDLQHIRRFVKAEFLPTHLRPSSDIASGPTENEGVSIPSESSSTQEKSTLTQTQTSHLFICPASLISLPEMIEILASNPPFSTSGLQPTIRVIPVPAQAPTSIEQAVQWSEKYWPIIYKNSNPYGPHPSIIKRAEAEILPLSGTFMALAHEVAKQGSVKDLGKQVGCVIVERVNGVAEIVTVAADARWCGRGGSEKQTPGNVVAHAAMRGIGIVAKKRLNIAKQGETSESTPKETMPENVPATESEGYLEADAIDIFQDRALTVLEERFFKQDNLKPNGYLCCDLEIYLTHEPCVMCSMAIMHSRFERCIFGKRMPLTGAMSADTKESGESNGQHGNGGLQHGIFWRPNDLNWKLLCWEWEEGQEDFNGEVEEILQI